MESVNTDKSSGIEVEGYCFINVQFERIPKPQILLQEGLLINWIRTIIERRQSSRNNL